MKFTLPIEYVRTASVAFAVACCCLTVTNQVQAQRMMGGGSQLMSSLLIIDEVQEEIGLSDEQIEKIAGPASELVDSMRSDMRDIMMGGGDQEEIADTMKEYKEEEQELVDLLNMDQQQRLTQLHYQAMGPGMYSMPDVQAALEFSDEQKGDIEDILGSTRDRMMEAMMDAQESGDRSEIMAAIEKVRKDIAGEIADSLTEEQKASAEEMKGKAFKFPERQRRGGGNRSDF